MTNAGRFRSIFFYSDHFEQFFIRQNEKDRQKILWTLELLEELQRIPESYLKHIENTSGLCEIRIQSGCNIFRVFCFFSEGNRIVVINRFEKKSQKTPRREIEKALKIMEE